MICGFDELFAVDIGYKSYRIGFKTYRWGYRLMLLWWHVCWHLKSVERKPYKQTTAQACQPEEPASTH